MSVVVSGPPPGLPAFDEAQFRSRAEGILIRADASQYELSIALVDDSEIAELNASYRGKRQPTDVLSFSMLEGDHVDHHGGMLGDVVISLPTSDRQARELGHSIDQELARLLVHGVLHLLGYDHERADEALVMEAREREILAAVLASEPAR